MTARYIAAEAVHLTKRVREIEAGVFSELVEQLMQKPLDELKTLYNQREIEK